MDFKQIKDLINLINDSKIGELKIEDKEFKLRIRHQNCQPNGGNTVYVPPEVASASASEATGSMGAGNEEAITETTKGSEESAEDQNLIIVNSPMIGTFYRSSGPDKPPYVKVGDHVNKEDVLCIIEAMKLFNEIESEISGRIVKVLVENEAPVEYDQPLFLIDPNG